MDSPVPQNAVAARATAAAARAAFLAERRALGPARMDKLFAPGYDDGWGHVNPSHHDFVGRLIDLTPAGSLLLDAACGTGKYWPQLLAAGRRVVGTDRSAGMLAQAAAKLRGAELHQLALEQLVSAAELAGRFAGLLCVDAMENVPPEDWPVVLAGFRRAVRPGGPVYLTVEIPGPDDREAAQRPRPPLVRGEVLWPDTHGGGYHYYPAPDQVATWLTDAGMTELAAADADGVLHVLARLR